MLKKKTDRILLASSVISFFLFIFSLSYSKKAQNVPVKSALLNPVYRTKIQTVIIQTPSEVLTLSRSENYWQCSYHDTVTTADPKTVEGLLKNLTRIRKMYKISDKNSAKSALNLTKDSANIITVIDSSSVPLTKLYFGSEDALTSRINVASEKGKISYETENDISPYLTADLDFWTESEIFYAVKNPSNLSLSEDDLHLLLSLRHGRVLSASSLPQNAELIYSPALYGQYEMSHRLDFYREKTKDGDNYYYTQKLSPSKINDNAVYEISSFTYEKIRSLLKKE